MEHLDRLRQLADEIGRHKTPDAYAMGRIRGFVEGAGTPAEKLAGIAEVVAAWDLALREPAERLAALVADELQRRGVGVHPQYERDVANGPGPFPPRGTVRFSDDEGGER